MVPLFVGTVARVLTFLCVGTKFVALSDPRVKALAAKPFVINELAACTRGGTYKFFAGKITNPALSRKGGHIAFVVGFPTN